MINNSSLSLSFTTIPSREMILSVLRQASSLMTEPVLAKHLNVKSLNYDALRKRLKAMQRDDQIKFDQNGGIRVLSTTNFVEGVVIGHRDGYGFVRRDDQKGSDIFLSIKEMQRLMHGDRVLVNMMTNHSRVRKEGRVVEILQRANFKIVGRLLISKSRQYFVSPADCRLPNLIEIPASCLLNARKDDMVEIKITRFPERYILASGKVMKVIGQAGQVKTEIEVVIRKFNIPYKFSEAAQNKARSFKPDLVEADFVGRIDLRKVPFVTIDEESAKDFDDAVYCEPFEYKQRKVMRLLVAIADVSHYVHDGDLLDTEALKRSCSVYFPQYVVPMLPEELSNELCSLKPKVDRCVLVCETFIDLNGEIVHYEFYPSLICSAARLSYSEVAELFNSSEEICCQNDGVKASLLHLHHLYKLLLKARSRRGAINFETTETFILYGQDGKIDTILPRHRNEAHQLIEECMLVANVCAANFLMRFNHPALYRIHAGPTTEKLSSLRLCLNEIGLELHGGDEPQAKDYADLMKIINGREDSFLLQTMLLRSLQQAVYSPKNIGHFGLAYPCYVHFTSPIRRYPDLIAHRAIRALLLGRRYTPNFHYFANSTNLKKDNSLEVQTNLNGEFSKSKESVLLIASAEHKLWVELGQFCSRNERRADEASRDIDSWFKCCFMKNKMGQVFNGMVTGVAPFGLFVTLKEFFIEGLIHISGLGKGRIRFDEDRNRLVNETNNQIFKLEDDISVKIVEVDLEQRKILLSPHE